MLLTLKRVTAVAGITAALASAGPVASAVADTPPSLPTLPGITMPPSGVTMPSITIPGQQQPAGSCGPNQGLPAGVVNLGPTGPMGPLGAYGPLGAGHLPCGSSVFDLGPGGPLGPGGALGPGGLFGGLPGLF